MERGNTTSTTTETAEQLDEPNEKSYMLRHTKPSTTASHRSYRIAVPDGEWGWYVVGGCAFANFLLPGMLGSFGSDILQDFAEIRELRYHDHKISPCWIPATFDVTFYLASSLSCVLCELTTHRTVTFLGGLLAFVGMILSSFANSIPYLYISYGVMVGFGAGLCYPAGILIVNQYFDKRRGLANGLSLAGTTIGSLAMPIYIRFLAKSYGYRGTILIASGIMLNMAVCALTYEPVDKYLRFVCSDENCAETAESSSINGHQDIDYYMTLPSASTSPSSTYPRGSRAPTTMMITHGRCDFAPSRLVRKPELFALSAVYAATHFAYAVLAEIGRWRPPPHSLVASPSVTTPMAAIADVAGRVLVATTSDLLPQRDDHASGSAYLNAAVLAVGGSAVILSTAAGVVDQSAATFQPYLNAAVAMVAGAAVALEPVVATRTLGTRWLPVVCSTAALAKGTAQLSVDLSTGLFTTQMRPLVDAFCYAMGAGLVTVAVVWIGTLFLHRLCVEKYGCHYLMSI